MQPNPFDAVLAAVTLGATATAQAIDAELARIAYNLGLTPERVASYCHLRTVTDGDAVVTECVEGKYGAVLFRVRTVFTVTKEPTR